MTDPLLERAKTRAILTRIRAAHGTAEDYRYTLAETAEAIVQRLTRERDEALEKLAKAQRALERNP